MQNKREWYGSSWKILRTQLIKLCRRHFNSFIESVQYDNPDYVTVTNSLLCQVIDDVSALIADDKLGLWENALPLLINSDKLAVELKREHDLFFQGSNRDKAVQPIQAFLRKFQIHLETNRRELVATGMGISPNKLKTWERLDSISRKISKNSTGGGRCNDAHFGELALHVSCEYGHDKNLPKRAETVKDYFYLFSEDCRKHIDNIEELNLKKPHFEAFELFEGIGKTELLKCLQGLEPKEMELIDSAFGLAIGKVVYTSGAAFRKNNSLTRNQFQAQKRNIMDKLLQCLELALATR